MSVLLPRLPAIAADRLLDQFLRPEGPGWQAFNPRDLPDATRFASTGGTPASAPQLQALRDGILDKASACGMGREGVRGEHARFDHEAAAWLTENSLLASGETLRDDVWTFVGVVMVPDVVRWRFERSRERYLGGVRNALQRLWLRGRVLDRGADTDDRWGLLHALTEDALVQLSERPSIGGDPRFALALAEAWVRAAERFGKGRMEPIMRRATLRIRVRNEIRSLPSLRDACLARLLDAEFDDAAVATKR